MHQHSLETWQHDHVFGQDVKRHGESRTAIVIAITATMMVVEIGAGAIYGSMALLADGLHMASHAAALSINVFAYVYARRHARNRSFSFGTGKMNALGGFSGAVLLGVFALLMAAESVERIVNPVSIAFNQAIFVAVLGLIVNGASVFILGEEGHDHHHDHADDHDHHHHHHDHNLRSAYLHVMADALTSLLAIVALLVAKYFGFIWVDPLMGIVGSLLVAKWSLGLLRSTSQVLLDKQGPAAIRESILGRLEFGDTRVADLHLWSIGPNIYSAIVAVVTHTPQSPDYYKSLVADEPGLAHVTVEVHQCTD